MTVLPDVASLNHWLAQSQMFITDEDRLIDSHGIEWAWDRLGQLKPTAKQWTLADLTPRVQQHFAAQSNCCVAKIAAPSLKQLIQLVVDAATD